MNDDREEWRPVPGFEATYEVSNLGRVRRSGKASVSGKGRGGGARIGRVLRGAAWTGYPTVPLWQNGIPHVRLVHILVAAAFLGPCPTGKEVNHKDGVRSNPHASNLEYVTRGGNMEHAYRTGLRASGEGHHWAKLTPDEVHAIRAEHALRIRGYSGYRPIARRYGVTREAVRLIIKGQNWKYLAEVS